MKNSKTRLNSLISLNRLKKFRRLNNLISLLKFVFLLTFILFTHNAYAEPPSKSGKLNDDSFIGLLGADFEYTHIGANGDWKNLVATGLPGGNVYVGARFFDHFGINFGYDFTNRRSKSHTFSNGESIFGVPVTLPPGVPFTATNTYRLEGWYLDAMGYVPFWNCFDFILTVGYGSMRAKLTDSFTLPLTPTPVEITTSRYAGMVRAGIGVQYMVTTNMVSIRGMLRWKQTAKIHLTSIDDFVQLQFGETQPFRDAVTFGIGVFLSY